ncbi:hypothetical protein H5P28_18355 [Ruficoccus amylovorans]|uniref:Uncharacterized protein n=1 Tax=Ruficoccus amylovorans TaxID=1804625 RepID=A0A842HHM0_9BACT|nr:hypothetical protein [Ruficoccus amylovorans]MBC2596235.1 hypothetical protein [Ruficoccus amylovorans]
MPFTLFKSDRKVRSLADPLAPLLTKPRPASTTTVPSRQHSSSSLPDAQPATGDDGRLGAAGPNLTFTMQEGVFTARLGRAEDAHPGLSRHRIGTVEADGLTFALEKTVLRGPSKEGAPHRRIALVTGFHGNEPGGPLACGRLYTDFLRDATRFAGLELHLYPASNPWGLLFSHRGNAAGHDLAGDFGQGSQEPETRALEEDFVREQFDTLITLFTDVASHGLYAYTSEKAFCHDFLIQAIESARLDFSLPPGLTFDGFHQSPINPSEAFPGSPKLPANILKQPGEILLELPGRASRQLQGKAAATIVHAILERLA